MSLKREQLLFKMATYGEHMNDKKIQTLGDIRAFLEETEVVQFSIEDKEARYQWIQETLIRFKYRSRGKKERGFRLQKRKTM